MTTPDPLRAAAEAAADWLEILQDVYHALTQRFPNETRHTCEAGLCGDYRKHRDALRAALATDTTPLDAERIWTYIVDRHVAHKQWPKAPERCDECEALTSLYARLTEERP